MCHPGLPTFALGSPAQRRARLQAEAADGGTQPRAAAAAAAVAAAREPPPPTPAAGCAAARSCICSPTTHPGSFRCRWHHGVYRWGGGKRRVTEMTAAAAAAAVAS